MGGGFGWHEPRIEPTPVIIPDDHYAWIFAHPVAIEPVEGVACWSRPCARPNA